MQHCSHVSSSFAAIGALNHKFFCLFLLCTAISCVISLALLILRLVHCGHHSQQQADASKQCIDDGPAIDTEGGRQRLLAMVEDVCCSECKDFFSDHLVAGLVICSLVFLVFTTVMGFEQLEVIEMGKGKIARMKSRVGSTGAEYSRVTEEFNEMFGGDSPSPQWHWFLPLQIKFPRGMKTVVLGCEFDETCDPVPHQELGQEDGNDNDTDLEMGQGRN